MPRPQFTIRMLLVLMLVVAAFFGGIRFERERQRRAEEVGANDRCPRSQTGQNRRDLRQVRLADHDQDPLTVWHSRGFNSA